MALMSSQLIISSTSNPKIKLLRKLRERKIRQETGSFYIEGLRILAEATQLGAQVEYLVVAPELVDSAYGHELVAKLKAKDVPVHEVTAQVFDSFALKEGPQGVAAVVRQRWETLKVVRPSRGDIWVALDSVQDPGNLGTILRTLDAAGGKGIILLDHTTDPYDPTAMRASMGAVFSQILVRASLDEFAAWKKAGNYAVVGTSGAAETDYHHIHYSSPLVLLMGSERQGLLPRHLELCDQLVRIPMVGRSDSLNLAIATALVLYEAFNQSRDERAQNMPKGGSQ
jgi:TrmH family RNA methyltransferase